MAGKLGAGVEGAGLAPGGQGALGLETGQCPPGFKVELRVCLSHGNTWAWCCTSFVSPGNPKLVLPGERGVEQCPSRTPSGGYAKVSVRGNDGAGMEMAEQCQRRLGNPHYLRQVGDDAGLVAALEEQLHAGAAGRAEIQGEVR